MVELYPVIKLNEPTILDTWKGLALNCLVVRLQDLICPRSMRLNSTFFKIKEKGGIHNFLDFDGKIILSLIMKDNLIQGFNPSRYSEVINTLKPDYYTIVDGETYEKEELISKAEIKRSFLETRQLIELCKDSKPIGQVKGCNKSQIVTHMALLKSLGIEDFVFHVGDFFRNGSPKMINRAKEYSLMIRKNAKTLILYGMGSQSKLQEFSFADAYTTFNYFVNAVNGKKFVGTKKYHYTGGYSPKIVRENLIQIIKNIANMKKQTKLIIGGVCPWEAEQEETGQVTLEQELVQATL